MERQRHDCIILTSRRKKILTSHWNPYSAQCLSKVLPTIAYIFFSDFVHGILDHLEKTFCKEAISRLATLITCSEYGLTETEILEILMPISESEAVISIEDANFNFSSLCSVKRKLGKCLWYLCYYYFSLFNSVNFVGICTQITWVKFYDSNWYYLLLRGKYTIGFTLVMAAFALCSN